MGRIFSFRFVDFFQIIKCVPICCSMIDDFKNEAIEDYEFQRRSHEIGLVIAEAEKAIVSLFFNFKFYFRSQFRSK